MASGCGCGGGRRFGVSTFIGPDPATRAIPTTQAPSDSTEETVFVKYVADEAGSRSFQGRATGQRYRFDTDDDHNVRRVFKADLPGLLSLGLFVEHSPMQEMKLEPLHAPGPPQA